MNTRRIAVLLVVALLVLVPVAGLAVLFFPPDFMYSHYNHVDYTTTVSTNATVENATFYLPLPIGSSGVLLGDELWIYDEDGTRMTDWETRVVESESGPMLELRIDRLPGETRYVLWTYDDQGRPVDRQEITEDEIPENMTNRRLEPNPTTYSLAWGVTVDRTVETRYPIGNESTLSPAYNVTAVPCVDAWSGTDTCWTFDSRVYATYDAPAGTTLTVGEVRYEGWNEWGFWLSNSFNTFESSTGAAVYTDGREGWTTVDGRLHGGMGRYDGPRR